MRVEDAFDQIDVDEDGILSQREGRAFIDQMIPEETMWEECFERNHIMGALMHFSRFFNTDGERGLSLDEFKNYADAITKCPEDAERWGMLGMAVLDANHNDKTTLLEVE